VWFAIDHGRRRILHFNITESPTARWAIQQLRETFPDEPSHRFLIYDNDAIFSPAVTRAIKRFEIDPKRTAFRSPWQNGTAERFVGSVRRAAMHRSVDRWNIGPRSTHKPSDSLVSAASTIAIPGAKPLDRPACGRRSARQMLWVKFENRQLARGAAIPCYQPWGNHRRGPGIEPEIDHLAAPGSRIRPIPLHFPCRSRICAQRRVRYRLGSPPHGFPSGSSLLSAIAFGRP